MYSPDISLDGKEEDADDDDEVTGDDAGVSFHDGSAGVVR